MRKTTTDSGASRKAAARTSQQSSVKEPISSTPPESSLSYSLEDRWPGLPKCTIEGDAPDGKARKFDGTVPVPVKGPKKIATGYEPPIAEPPSAVDLISNEVIKRLEEKGYKVVRR